MLVEALHGLSATPPTPSPAPIKLVARLQCYMIAVFTAWHRIADVKLHHSLSHTCIMSSGILAPKNTYVATPLATPNCYS